MCILTNINCPHNMMTYMYLHSCTYTLFTCTHSPMTIRWSWSMAQRCLLLLAEPNRAWYGGTLFRSQGPCLPPAAGSPDPNHHGGSRYGHCTLPGILAGENSHEKRITQDTAQSAQQCTGMYELATAYNLLYVYMYT